MEVVKFDRVQERIIEIRNQQVILDADLAYLYGVETRDINKAVKNNPEKFPIGYVFELTKSEKSELVEIFHRFNPLKHSTSLPKAFTEKGLYMMATILRSSIATQTTISIIETFAKLKNLTRTIKQINDVENESNQKSLLQKSSEIIADLLDDNLEINQSETTIEFNFAMLKVKHTVKRK